MFIFHNLYSIISVLNIFLAIAVIFIERRNIGVTWAWLMILLFLPGVGFVTYLLFGQNLSKRKIYKIKQSQLDHITFHANLQKEQFQQGLISFNDPVTEDFHSMIQMNLANDSSFFTQDNQIQIFTDGIEKFDALIHDIRNAKHHIHLMYYIVRNDLLGRRLMDILKEKVEEGVEVRLMYDDIGSAWTPKKLFTSLIRAGGEVAVFFPSRIPYLNIRFNFRNHRKLAIIDGEIGYIGGFNIGDEYIGLNPRFGYWRDTHLRIAGSSVLQMQSQFIMDWNIAAKLKMQYSPEFFPREAENSAGRAGVQILSSGPNNAREQIKNAYIKMIYSAKESVYLQTPYFIPDESLLGAIRMAALSGIDVRIMIPAKPDHKIVYWASYSYLGDLLDAGVRCYLYGKGFLHTKTIVVDGVVGSVGTMNIDIRSFKLNFEINAIVYDSETAAQLKDIFEADQKDCIQLTSEQYYHRSKFHHLRESLTRLLSPIL